MNLTLGKNVSKAKSTQECMELAGLDYRLELEQMHLRGQNDVDGIPVIGKAVPNRFAVVRQDNREPIATVGNRYHITQNAEVFGFFDGLVEQGLATFKRAYSTKLGARVSILCDLGGMNIGGDKSRRHITLRTSHDGSSRITGTMEVYRLVCKNGLMAWRNECQFAIKHTKSAAEKLREAKKIIGIADQYYKWFAEQANRLVEMPLTSTRAMELIKELVPAADEDDVSGRVLNQREAIRNFFESGDGNHGENRWDLYNGVTQYVDHWRSKNRQAEIAVETNLVGSGAKLKKNAFDHLLTVS